jgi:hypothetical protein
MDIQDKEEIESKVSENIKEYQKIIKNVEKASLQTGITLEEGIKFLHCLCTSNYN